MDTLLILQPHDSRHLKARANRLWGRLLARVLGSWLDGVLARGRSSDSSLLLAARAQELVSPAKRTTLVENWEELLFRAQEPRLPRDPRVPVDRTYIVAHEPDIRVMLDALSAPLPVPSRGVAMASRLLTDGTGPLYDGRRSADLISALRRATAELDPSHDLSEPIGSAAC